MSELWRVSASEVARLVRIGSIAAAAHLTIASIAAPAPTQPQPAGSVSAVTDAAPSSSRVNGRRALLNTSAPGESAMSHSAVKSLAPVDGAIALLEQSGVVVSSH
jgi:hypothetical protein